MKAVVLTLFSLSLTLNQSSNAFVVHPLIAQIRHPAVVAFNDFGAQDSGEIVGDQVDQELHPESLIAKKRAYDWNRARRALITDIDAPLRLHAASATLYSVGSFIWLTRQLFSLASGTVEPLDGGITCLLADRLLFASAVGLIVSGQRYLPKGPRFEYYRKTFIDTGWIMLADMMLWLWFAGGAPPGMEFFITLVTLAALAGDIGFITRHDVTRNEFYDRGLITEEFQKPIWSLTVWATHAVLISLKSWGLYHVLTGGTMWLETNPEAASFGALLYMSTSMVASWSAFTQGTMVLRKTPAFGKDVFVLVNDFPTWCVFIGCFAPLITVGWVGFDTSILPAFFSF